MSSSKIVGYKKVFGFIMPNWIDENAIQKYLYGFLAFVMMWIVLILFIWPRKETLVRMEKDIQVSEARLASLRESKTSLESLDSNIEESVQKAVFMAMPVTYSPQDAIASMRLIASKSGVSISSYNLPGGVLYDETANETIKTSAKGGGAKFQSFRIKVSVAGKINSLMSFIENLEKSLPVATVSDLAIQELTSMAKKNANTNVQLDLEVVYYQPQIKSFDLSSLKRFTAEELELMNELASYSTAQSAGDGVQVSTPSATVGGRNLFGL